MSCGKEGLQKSEQSESVEKKESRPHWAEVWPFYRAWRPPAKRLSFGADSLYRQCFPPTPLVNVEFSGRSSPKHTPHSKPPHFPTTDSLLKTTHALSPSLNWSQTNTAPTANRHDCQENTQQPASPCSQTMLSPSIHLFTRYIFYILAGLRFRQN